jgi:C1A family cysteine protease
MLKYKLNVKPDRKDNRDFILNKKKFYTSINIGSSASLRSSFPAVYDQGEEGSCTGNGWCGFREYWQIVKNVTPFVPLSRQFIYYWERAMEGNINVDSGASISDGGMVLNKQGVCPELDDPYTPQDFAICPNQKAINDALAYRISAYYRVNDLNGVKLALTQGLPVVIGVDVYESFQSSSAAQTGVIPMPDTNNEQLLGGHCIVICGYQDTSNGILGIGKQGFITFRNSWSDQWGDKGYGTMEYPVFKKIVNDMWTGTV